MFSICFIQKLSQLMKQIQKPTDKAHMKGLIFSFSQGPSSFDRIIEYFVVICTSALSAERIKYKLHSFI